ncbi:MAG: glycosyltransferase family 1 protein [Alphaproteobacteria bacterium]|nr:glycosyltransferase family 1 protein [Alphaproteobacteria bacterium]
MRIVLVTDAWFPQVNGVVRTLNTVVEHARAAGHEVLTITPDQFRTFPCPTYPEIRLALRPGPRMRAMIADFGPDAVHIATEGPLGQAAQRICRANGWPLTTSFHTKFPEYIHARARVPVAWTYAWMRRFHGRAARVMVATNTVDRELRARGFDNTVLWTRGVDTELFRPRPHNEWPDALRDLPRPIQLYTGRVAVEKNISAFLDLDTPGSKVVVGDGPQRRELAARFPDVHFAGERHGEDLARHFAAADVFVFPSRTDTFGLVLLEALASGVPVAAYPVPGPLDVVGRDGPGCLNEDLAYAVETALATADAEHCRRHALGYSWARCAEMFVGYLAPFDRNAREAA